MNRQLDGLSRNSLSIGRRPRVRRSAYRMILRLSACGWLLILGLVGGCQQGMYEATALPPGLAAQPTVDVSTLDLSRLATLSENPSSIRPGDILNVTVSSGIEQKPQQWELSVAEDGTIDIPLVGTVPAAAHELRDVQQFVRQASIQRGLYRRPSVSVSLHERHKYRVTVTGAVKDPGTYELPVAEAHLLSALVAAGGLTVDADTVVEVRQPSGASSNLAPAEGSVVATASYRDATQTSALPGTRTIDLVSATTGNSSPASNQYVLDDGAVVVVRQRSKRYVHVIGLVNKPNRFELPAGQNVTVLDAVAMAQGLSLNVADKVVILRNTALSPQPVSIDVSIAEAKENPSANLLLSDGDIVSVEETAATLAVGAFKQFVRVGLRASDFY